VPLGASPTPVNNNDLYTGMQTHIVDGAGQPLISIESAKYYEVSKRDGRSGSLLRCPSLKREYLLI
jgi:hypothetical protein